MADDSEIDRTKVTFSQAEGLASLPQPLALGQLSEKVRSLIWRVLYESIDESRVRLTHGHPYIQLGTPWVKILYDYYTEELFKSPSGKVLSDIRGL
jgi:hypothetical protein